LAKKPNSGLAEGDLFHYEKALLDQGVSHIAGVDEAGRGPLAGPVVAAAVMFPGDWIRHGLPEELVGLNDSKQLTPLRRERFFGFLSQSPHLQWAIVHVDSRTIDQINILQATHRAMIAALSELTKQPEHALVDGLRVPSLALDHTSLVRGDSLSYSIAAASVLAKVSRDRFMVEQDRKYPTYGFAQHKGYPTTKHRQAIQKSGPCPIHRGSFLSKILEPTQSELKLK